MDKILSAITDANCVVKDEKHKRKLRKFLCNNSLCMSELHTNLTGAQFQARFYFTTLVKCPVCAIGNMYLVKEE